MRGHDAAGGSSRRGALGRVPLDRSFSRWAESKFDSSPSNAGRQRFALVFRMVFLGLDERTSRTIREPFWWARGMIAVPKWLRNQQLSCKFRSGGFVRGVTPTQGARLQGVRESSPASVRSAASVSLPAISRSTGRAPAGSTRAAARIEASRTSA
jgi:hypothetical protein